MHITFERDGDTARIRRMIWAASRRNLRRVQILALFFVLLGVVLAALNATFLAILCLALAVAYAVLPWWAVSKRLRRVRPLFAEPAQYTITETDVTVDTPSATQTFRWTGLVGVKETAGFWIFLNRAKMPSVIIPQDCMRPEDLLELRTFLATRRLTPAEYRI